MDFGIIDFCLQNTPFFDIGTGASRDYELVSSDLPAGWVRILDSTWCYLNPLAVDTVEQGWKIHVSAHPDDGEQVLELVTQLCLRSAVPVKFLRSRAQLVARNSKYADRTASGKFIAI